LDHRRCTLEAAIAYPLDRNLDRRTKICSYQGHLRLHRSGSPAVMEKGKIDTEVRKLDMLRAAHFNQQYGIGRQVRDLPGRIENCRECHAGLLEDISTRDAHEGKEFTITVDGREFSGKNAREEAGTALIQVIMASLWEDSRELKLKPL
jgi:hypothetical protein